ncbi:MAG TPA: dTDP-4-dehydrorhamnose reductase [Dehalococcoidia bacterium]|nr:dTDP-4-dehydrorhamnose reductase [Dehalococcoidia bacterium]
MNIKWRHRIFITGANGQLGRALQLDLADGGVAGSWSEGGRNNLLTLYSQHERRFRQNIIRALDITDAEAVMNAVGRDEPDIVINCAAWTDTVGCERDPARATAVNAGGAANVARAAAELGAALVHISTNEVFDGTKDAPYDEDDGPNPINEYGRSKLAGEEAVRAVTGNHYIVRTSWVYGPGRVSFPEKIIERALADGRIRGVTDEIASPTWTNDLAAAIARLIETEECGTYHLTGASSCSRLEWAQEVLRLAGIDVPAESATQADFDLPVRKPLDSRLANNRAAALGITLRPWREALREHMETKQVTDMLAAEARR